jgi:hypothetical protein
VNGETCVRLVRLKFGWLFGAEQEKTMLGRIFIAALAGASLSVGAAAAQSPSGTEAPAGTDASAKVYDIKPNQPGGLVLLTGVPWNDNGDQMPLATVEGVNDGRLEVFTMALIDPQTGASAVGRVISNTPIPDSIESRVRFGGPKSQAGRSTTPRPGSVENPASDTQ